MSKSSLRIITDVSEFLNTINKSCNLFAPSNICAPSLNLYWLTAFIRHYGEQRKLVIAIATENGKINLLAPFHKKGDTELELLCDETSDYNDVFYSYPSETTLQTVIEELFFSGVKTIKFTQLPSDSKTILFLQSISQTINIKFQVEQCNVIPVVTPVNKPVSSWDGTHSSLVKKYEKKLCKLQSLEKLKFSTITTKDEFEAEFPDMIKMHIERWNHVGINSKYLDTKRQSFTYEVCEEAINRKSFLTHLLKINDTLAAYNIGFLGCGTLFDWNSSFALQFGKMSPGALLQLATFVNFNELGFTKYNFMKGSEPYKFTWTREMENTVTITLSQT